MKHSANTPVANWLMIGVIMVMVQIALGGITRLTGSGLSITEWDIVTGTLPPLSETAWSATFEKYKNTPQFRLLNSDFSLAQFKFIFFWEWLHRVWARLLFVVFAIGFVYFLVTRSFKKGMVQPLVVLFLLGGLQGLVGWIMVASGLEGDAVYVKPTRLALHFIFALGLLSYTYWFYLLLKVPTAFRSENRSLAKGGLGLLLLLAVQLVYGALMAGHKAASVAPTWPSINGFLWLPAGWFLPSHGLLNFLENKLLIHFIHRGLAYFILFYSIVYCLRIKKLAPNGSVLHNSRWILAKVAFLQVLLGIFSVLTSVGIVPNRWGSFEWMAQLHQLTGMLYLLVLIRLLFLTKPVAIFQSKKQ